jgi:hypothetical protein
MLAVILGRSRGVPCWSGFGGGDSWPSSLMLPPISASLICSRWWYLVNITIQRDMISISKSSIGAIPLPRMPSTLLRHFHFCPVTLHHCIIHAPYENFPTVLHIFKAPEWRIQNEMKIKGHEASLQHGQSCTRKRIRYVWLIQSQPAMERTNYWMRSTACSGKSVSCHKK